MTEQQLSSLVTRRMELSSDIKASEEERKFTDSLIREELEARGEQACKTGDFQVRIVTQVRRSLDKKKLLAAGVDPRVIAACEVESAPSVSVRITPVKEQE